MEMKQQCGWIMPDASVKYTQTCYQSMDRVNVYGNFDNIFR